MSGLLITSLHGVRFAAMWAFAKTCTSKRRNGGEPSRYAENATMNYSARLGGSRNKFLLQFTVIDDINYISKPISEGSK